TAANPRSVFSASPSSAADSCANAPAAFNLSNSTSFSAGVPCMSRRSVSRMLLFAFASFLFRNIEPSSPRHENSTRSKHHGRDKEHGHDSTSDEQHRTSTHRTLLNPERFHLQLLNAIQALEAAIT